MVKPSLNVTLCPVQCRKPKFCLREDEDGPNNSYGIYYLVCLEHGTQEISRIYEGGAHQTEDWYADCPFCEKPRSEHTFVE